MQGIYTNQLFFKNIIQCINNYKFKDYALKNKVIYAYITLLTSFAAVAKFVISVDTAISINSDIYLSKSSTSQIITGVNGFGWIPIFSIVLIPFLRRRNEII